MYYYRGIYQIKNNLDVKGIDDCFFRDPIPVRSSGIPGLFLNDISRRYKDPPLCSVLDNLIAVFFSFQVVFNATMSNSVSVINPMTDL